MTGATKVSSATRVSPRGTACGAGRRWVGAQGSPASVQCGFLLKLQPGSSGHPAKGMNRAGGSQGVPRTPFNALSLIVPPVNHQVPRDRTHPEPGRQGLLKKKLANPLSVWPVSYEEAGPLTFPPGCHLGAVALPELERN